MVRQIETHEEFETILKNQQVNKLVVDFTATWCGPCQRIGPVFEKISKNCSAENVCFIKIDVDENSETTEYCKVDSMPTFVFFYNGKEHARMVGANSEKLTDAIDKFIYL
jgi:thioredoxin